MPTPVSISLKLLGSFSAHAVAEWLREYDDLPISQVITILINAGIPKNAISVALKGYIDGK